MRCWSLLLLMAWLGPAGVAQWATPAAAQESPAPEAAAVLKFRRIYAPEDDVALWPRANVRYLPIEPAEFEELAATIRSVPSTADTSAAASLAEANYAARLQGDALVDGTSRIQVDHAVEGAALVPLDPCNLAIGDAQWSGAESLAMVGLDSDGRLAVLVREADQLELAWSLRGTRDAAGTLSFTVELPRCPASTLELELPAEMNLTADRGVVTSHAVEPPAVEDQVAAAPTRRWRVVLGGVGRVTLEISPQQIGGRAYEPIVREAVTYEVSTRAVDISSQLRLDVQHEPLRSLPITVDAGLELVAVRYGESELNWTTLKRLDDGREEIEVVFPEPLRGTGRLLRLSAICPLVTDRPWRLPRMIPRGVFWQEGTSTLLVPEPLSIQRIEPQACRQSKTGPLPWPLAGDSIELQHFSPESSVQVVISRHQEPVQLTSATTLTLGGSRMLARFDGNFTLAAGQRFLLRGEIPEAWAVDAVEVQPSSMQGDWTIAERDGTRTLSVRLTEALSAEQPVRLIVSAHAPRMQPQARYPAERFDMLRFPTAMRQRQLLGVRVVSPYRLQLHDATQLERLDRARLDSDLAALLDDSAYDLLVDAESSSWSLSIEEQLPRYEADVLLTASVAGDQLTQHYLLKCRPESTPVQRVLVQLTKSGEQELHWTLGSQVRGQLVARRLTVPANSLWQEGELWEITLLEPTPEPFELEATRQSPLVPDEDLPLALVAMPEASIQRATVVIEAPGDAPLAISSHSRLSPLPPGLLTDQPERTVRAAFRYEHLPTVPDAGQPLVLRRPSSDAAHSGAIVWSCRIETRRQPQGKAWHQAVCRIENFGREACRITPPESAKMLGMWLNNDELELVETTGGYSVQLPPHRRFNTFTASFETEEAELGFVGHGAPPQLQWDVPVLSRRWTVWLPSGYEMLSPNQSWQALQAPRLSWAQRLFGPLSRAQEQPPFDPFDSSQWSELTGDTVSRTQAIQQHLSDCCEQLGFALAYAQPQRGQRLRWGDVLAVAASPATGWADRLLIDTLALGEAGIDPDTALGNLATEQQADAAQAGVALLSQNGLVLLVESEMVVLTTAVEAATHGEEVVALPMLVGMEVTPGGLARQIQQAASRQSPRFIPVSAWMVQPTTPWLPARDAQAATGYVGWQAWQIDTGSSQAVSAWVVRISTLRALGTALGLLLFSALWWRLRERIGALLTALGAAAAVAMLAPAALAPITSAAVLACLAALGGALLLPARPDRGALQTGGSSVAPRSAVVQSGVVVAMIGLALLALAGAASAQTSGTEPEGLVYEIFIPSDENGQPTGGRYLVPEEFYTRLRELAAEAAEVPREWMIRSARYEATLQREAISSDLAVADCWAQFDLNVFADGALVTIPFDCQAAGVIADSALLNGRAVELAINADGTAMTCDVPTTGRNELRVALRPMVSSDEHFSELEFGVPRVPSATLELLLPSEAPQIEVPSALGPLQWDDDRQWLTASLGPASSLAVRWSEEAMHSTPQSADVAQSYWLKVTPGSVVLDAQFKVAVLSGQLDALRIAASPRLRLLPQQVRDPLIGAIVSTPSNPQEPGSHQLLDVRFASPVSEEATVRLSFLVSGASGVGQLRLPDLGVIGPRSVRRTLAISIDPLLQFQVLEGEQLAAMAVPEFTIDWEGADTLPQLAFQLPAGPANWMLSVQPHQPKNTAQQLRRFSYDARRLHVRLDAEIDTTGGYVFQHQILAPADLRIESLSLLEDGAQRLDRWTRDESGAINVLLTGPVSGPQQLSLRGWLPLESTGAAALPGVRLEGCEIALDQVQLYRRAGVLVEVTQKQGFDDQADQAASGNTELGRPVATWKANGPDARATLLVSPNDPRAEVAQLTTLSRDEQSWTVEVDSRWRVEQGLLDLLQLQIPPELIGPFEISPAMSGEVVQTPEARLLVLRPRAAVESELQVVVRGRLDLPAGATAAAPNILPLGAQKVDRYFRLPTQLGLQQVDWQVDGMERVGLPEIFGQGPLGRQAFATYRVSGEQPRATLRAVERGSAVAAVTQANYQLAWQAGGEYQAQATFDIKPAGMKLCRIRMPAGAELRQLSIAGVPTTAAAGPGNIWEVPLLFDQLPLRIELLYDGRVPEEDVLWDGIRVSAPEMVGLPVERTLWAVYGPPNAGMGEADEAASMTRLRQEMVRLRHQTELLSPDPQLIGVVPPDTLRDWYATWLRRWMACRASIRRQLLEAPATSNSLAVEAEAAAVERELRRSAEALGMLELLEEAERLPPRADRPSELWSAAFQGARPITRCALDGAGAQLTLRYPRAENAEFYWRTAVCGLGLATVLLARRRLSRVDALRRWPHVLGVLVGLAWWLWLTPSILGWAIIVVSLLASVLPGVRMAQEPASTVVRLTTNSR